jgi:cytochrome c oxidase subunit III
LAAKSSHLAHHFATARQQHDAAALGMWIFLATELMLFGGLFLAYTVYRIRNPVAFEAASGQLNLAFGAVNTVVLLTSSLTMALAVYWVQIGEQRRVVLGLIGTALLGTAFLVIKGFEYHADYQENLMPGLAFDPQEWIERGLRVEQVKGVEMFLVIYYIMTGLHAVHLVIGITLIAILAAMAWRERFTPAYYYPVEVGGLYWHFVDVIWVFLLPLLYLAGVRQW